MRLVAAHRVGPAELLEERDLVIGEPEVPWARVTTAVQGGGPLVSVSSPRAGEVIRVSSREEVSLPVTNAEEIVRFAHRSRARAPEASFRLWIDEHVRASTVSTILGALRVAGAGRVIFVARQKTVGKRDR